MEAARSAPHAEIARTVRPMASSVPNRAQREQDNFKRFCFGINLDLHAKARLGMNRDERKPVLLRYDFFARQHAFSAIDLIIMPIHHLDGVRERLAGLEICFAATKEEIAAASQHLHRGFKPTSKTPSFPAIVAVEKARLVRK